MDLGTSVENLTAMSARSHDFAPVFEKARQRLRAANAENFGSGGMPVGGWAPRSTIAPWPLLVRTAKLSGDLISLTGPANHIGPNEAEFGTDVEYAHFHQHGTTKMAARKIVYEPRGFAEAVGDDAMNHIMGLGQYF